MFKKWIQKMARRALQAELRELQDRVTGLEICRKNDRERRERNVAWPKPATRLAPRQVEAAMDVDDTAELWLAVHQELDDAIMAKLDDVTLLPSERNTPDVRTHIAGGAEALREFQKRLLDLQRAARRPDAGLAEEGRQ